MQTKSETKKEARADSRKTKPVLISLVDRKSCLCSPRIAKEDRYKYGLDILTRARITTPGKCVYHVKHKAPLTSGSKRANTCLPSPLANNTPMISASREKSKEDEDPYNNIRKGCAGEINLAERKQRRIKTPLPEAEPRKVLVEEFKDIENRVDTTKARLTPNDCTMITNQSKDILDTSDQNVNKSAFVVCSHDEILKEELTGLKKELHKERQKNAELWSFFRKLDSELVGSRKIHAELQIRNKKNEYANMGVNNTIKRLEEEGKECGKYKLVLEDEMCSKERKLICRNIQKLCGDEHEGQENKFAEQQV